MRRAIIATLVVAFAVFNISFLWATRGPGNPFGEWSEQLVANRCVGIEGPCIPSDASTVIVDGVLCSNQLHFAEVEVSWRLHDGEGNDIRGLEFLVFREVDQRQERGCVTFNDECGDMPSFVNVVPPEVRGQPSDDWYIHVEARNLGNAGSVSVRTPDIKVVDGAIPAPVAHTCP